MQDWLIEHMQPDDWRRVRAVRLRALADAPDAFGTTLCEDEALPPETWRERLGSSVAATFLACGQDADLGLVVGAPYDAPTWRYPGPDATCRVRLGGPTSGGSREIFRCVRFWSCSRLSSPLRPSLDPRRSTCRRRAFRKAATHIVTGEVKAIYQRVVKEGNWKVTRYVAEVAIEKVEKGDDLKADGLVYARYWRRSWNSRKPQPPSTGGHRGIPKEGDTLRIYLARNAYDGFGTVKDNGYTVFGANGFEKLKK